MIGRIEETSASFEARSAPRSYPTTAVISGRGADFVATAPDAIYAFGLPAAQALHQATRTIPIVFTQVADSVGFGLVANLPHPGGNVTGFMAWELSIGGKWLDLLREIAPGLRRVGVVYNPDTGRYAQALIFRQDGLRNRHRGDRVSRP
jgi:ABC-type uncharacterized transport system substrate-binding protein